MIARPNRGFWPVTALLSAIWGVLATIAAALFRKQLFA